MSWNNPLSVDRVLSLIEALDLPPGAAVLDFGCGTGELCEYLNEGSYRAVGVELESDRVVEAQREGRTVRLGDIRTCDVPPNTQLAVCLGSTHAFGTGDLGLQGFLDRLEALESVWAVVGVTYQRKSLEPEYEAILGTPHGLENSHAENVLALERSGWTVEHAITATEAEWDAFEWAHFRARGDVAWRNAWLRWGRDTMGFGLYAARRG